ncbi:hypothetical protein BLA29_002530 [Euroglyphus maynei]|uniref:Uncharacterized protein n=1 Tax=Euroglyphus maynei TaxID=6958 RepID=A0A1Y3BGD8_EURMA|nr:hypothetical protein BLA29_002530 [Euroglyphus maynei]
MEINCNRKKYFRENDGEYILLQHMNNFSNVFTSKLHRQLQKLIKWIDDEIMDCFFISAYEDFIDKLDEFINTYGSFNIDHQKFEIIQAKVKTLIESSEISPNIKESLKLKLNLTKQLAPNLKVTRDKTN